MGLLVSIFQATTQIQEQTLTFVPKILLSVYCSFRPVDAPCLVDFGERRWEPLTIW